MPTSRNGMPIAEPRVRCSFPGRRNVGAVGSSLTHLAGPPWQTMATTIPIRRYRSDDTDQTSVRHWVVYRVHAKKRRFMSAGKSAEDWFSLKCFAAVVSRVSQPFGEANRVSLADPDPVVLTTRALPEAQWLPIRSRRARRMRARRVLAQLARFDDRGLVVTSKRSAFMTLTHAATKSRTNFCPCPRSA